MLRRSRMTPEQLSEIAEQLRARDPELVATIEKEFGGAADLQFDPTIRAALGRRWGDLTRELALRSIIMRKGRPALAVRNGSFDVGDVDDPEATLLLDRLATARRHLELRLPAVGRVEVEGNSQGEIAGTGWLVTPTIVVTNAHVARKFAVRFGRGFRFLAAKGGGRQTARIDFLAEVDNQGSHEIPVSEVLWIAPDELPDIAFLRLEQLVDIEPIPLASKVPKKGSHIAAIGYPVRGGDTQDPELVDSIFAGLYTHKCLSPGMAGLADDRLRHDCSTLPGNSGSVILDLNSGEAVGLHFLGGQLGGDNYAVSSHVVAEALRRFDDLAS